MRDRERDRDRKRYHDRDRSRERADDRRRTDKDLKRDRDRDREGDRDRNRDRDRDRDLDHRRDKHEKRDARDKLHDRSRSSRHDDDDEQRKEKEDRRRRDRKRAEELVNAAPKNETVRVEEDGVPWYEARTTAQQAAAPLPSKAFFLDTVGDRDIARWNLTSSESTPRYRRDAGKLSLSVSVADRQVAEFSVSMTGCASSTRETGRTEVSRSPSWGDLM